MNQPPDGHGGFSPVAITAAEFAWITNFLRERTGIELKEGKQALVTSRLDRRLRHHGSSSYADYFALLGRHDLPEETIVAVDLLTTNETSFFPRAAALRAPPRARGPVQ